MKFVKLTSTLVIRDRMLSLRDQSERGERADTWVRGSERRTQKRWTRRLTTDF
jgi:hypothetical protein